MLCFILNKVTLSTFLVLKVKFRCGTTLYWKDNWADYFYKSSRKNIVFCTNAELRATILREI